MNTFITSQEFEAAFPNNCERDVWTKEINDILPITDINTPKRVSYFLAQTSFESNDFIDLEENLNYSASRLTAVFPHEFPRVKDAIPYAHNPQKIANKVYANRMGNGNALSGDGWLFRGRGIIQLTGRENYTRCEQAIGLNLLDAPDMLVTNYDVALKAAIWFWHRNRLNTLADTDNHSMITKVVSGCTRTDEERYQKYLNILNIINGGNPNAWQEKSTSS